MPVCPYGNGFGQRKGQVKRSQVVGDAPLQGLVHYVAVCAVDRRVYVGPRRHEKTAVEQQRINNI